MPSADLAQLLEQVDAEKLANRTLALVKVPSVSGEEGAIADMYRSMLESLGLRVDVDLEFPESPSLTVRWGKAAGPVIQFDGHLDTVPDIGQTVARRGDVIYARGACDMKGGLAVIVEVMRLLVENDVELPGSILITAHGQHEQSVGGRELHAPLRSLLRRGIKGDVCIIPEGPDDAIALSGKGAVIFTARFRRPGDPVHEILSGPNPPPNPIMAAHRFVALLQERAKSWTLTDSLVGPESFFIGKFEGGDLYNRIPVVTEVSGTRRYPKGRSYREASTELEDVAKLAARELGVEVELQIDKSGQPFRLLEDDPLVKALRRGYQRVTGKHLAAAGMRYSGDVSQFINEGGISAVYHGTDQTSAHSDFEYVPIGALVRCSKVLLTTALSYLASASGTDAPFR